MIQLLPAVIVFVFCLGRFCWLVQLDYRQDVEIERQGDEHVMREIVKFYISKGLDPTILGNATPEKPAKRSRIYIAIAKAGTVARFILGL